MMGIGHLSAVIPAAGLSSRMEAFKPLLPLDYRTVIEKVVSGFKAVGVKDIIVVAGHRKHLLTQALRDKNVRIVENRDYERGMFSSVRAGVAHLHPDSRAFFLLPADIPLVRQQTLTNLAQAYDVNTGSIIYPVFYEKHGHPPLIPSELAPHILQWHGEGGLKAFLNNTVCPSVELPVADRYILQDMDYHADYLKVMAFSKRHDIPTAAECEYILSVIHPVSEKVRRHCRKVALVSECIGRALIEKGVGLNLDSIEAGALLHDLAKGQKEHALVGEKIVSRMGFPNIGRIVGAHTDLSFNEFSAITEAEVVHIADKLVEGDHIISMAQRFQKPLARWGHDAVAVGHIKRRQEIALMLQEKIEGILETSIEKVLDALN
jgi:CTP:molybdopterin cytidylyltransferase MocA